MALLTGEIRQILNANGLIKMPNKTGAIGCITGGCGGDLVVDNNYDKRELTANVAANEITMTRVGNAATGYNCTNVATIDVQATIGSVGMPGYVYTGMFSGCVFYLFRKGSENTVVGVHAYSGVRTTITTKGRWLWKRQVRTEAVVEYGPNDYMLRNGLTQLVRHQTRGELSDNEKMGGHFLAFLSCVERNAATTFLFCYKGVNIGDAQVVRLIAEHQDAF